MCGRKTFLIAVIVIFLFIGGSAFAITPAKETQTNVLMPTGVTSTTSFNNLSSLLPAYQQSQDMMAVESSAGYDPEITELARGLKNDPNLIFKYVYNHIDHIPMHGSVKGAYMTLMDGFGNSYDQSSLLVALLRESGYTASFVYGFIYPDLATVMNWFGTQDEDTINEILSDSGIVGWVWKPSDLSGEYVVKTHVWVKVNINGTDYLLDPSLKAYEYTDGINLQTATGYNESTFLSSVLTNATVQTDYVKDINKSNLNSKLSTYSSNLISYINTNMPCAKLEDVIGGRKIIPITEVTWQTSLPYVLQVIEEWTDISDDHKHVLRVQHLITDVGDPNDPNDDVYAIDVNLYSEDIYGRRLTISYNEDAYGDVYPVLNLDGSVIDEADSSDAVSVGSNQKIKLSADHPYSGQSGTLHDSDRTTSIKAGGTYFVLNFWGNAPNLDIIEKHRNILKNYLDLGYSLYSEKVLGESSTIMGLTWVAEKFKFIEISNRVNNFRKLWHHGMGICGYYDSAYIDIFGYGTSTVSLSGDDTNEREYSFGIWGFGSALESGMIEQLQPDVNGISTVELINLANNNSHKIFHTTSSNYNSTIKPQLQNYSSGILSNIESMLNDGYELILPEYGDLVIDDWQGTGYLYYDGTNGYGAGYMISGGLNGGHSGSSSPIDTQSLHASTVVKPKNRSSKDHSKSWDPIDLVTGKYLYHNSDLQIGSGNYPFSLEFARYYNSISESQKGHMGQGWTHNFELTANSLSDGFQSLGIDSPIDAATAITTTYICMDLMVSDDSHRNIVIMTLAHQWLMDQMVNNTVLVQQPSNGMQFVKLPDGSYNPPPGDASTLSLEGDGSYSLRTKHGEYLDFDTDGRIEKWRDQHNNFVNFTYNYTDTLISSLDDDLVSHWKLNAYSTYGNGIVDSVGSNHGTLSNPSNVSLLAGEHIGNSLAFNNPNPQSNDNGGVIIGDDPSLELQEFTLSFWVKFDSMSSWNGGVAKGYLHAWASECSYTLEFYSTEAMARVTIAEDRGSSVIYYNTIASIDDMTVEPFGVGVDEWHMWTMTADGQGVSLYLDGKMCAYTEHAHDFPITYDDDLIDEQDFGIAADSREEYGLDGAVDDVRFYNRVLLEDEVKSVYEGDNRAVYERDWTSVVVNNNLGHNLTLNYNDDNRISSVTDLAGRSTHYDYDSNGNLTSVTDANGSITTFVYDPNNDGRMTQIYYPTNPGNPFVTNVYDSLGHVKEQTDANGHTYYYYYSGNRTEEVDPNSLPKVYEFNNLGRTIAEKNQLDDEILYEYDGQQRQTLITYPRGNSVQYSYDNNHNVTQILQIPIPESNEPNIVESFVYEPNFNHPISNTDPNGNITTFSYYANGNLKQINQPEIDGNVPQTHFTYNSRGQKETNTDAEGMVTIYEYDAGMGNLLRIIVDYGVAPNLNITTEMTYNSVGDVITRTDPLDNTTTFVYDPMRRLIRETTPSPFSYITTYGYDFDGNLKTVKRQTGNPAHPWRITSYTYTATGKKDTMTDPNGNMTQYEYDLLDRLWKTIDPENNITEQLYDPAGRLWKVIDAEDNNSVTYTYTLNGNTETLTDAKGYITTYEYDDYDRLEKMIYPDSTYERLSYDERYNVIEETTRKGETISYCYDVLGRLKEKNLQGQIILYEYDLLGRLTGLTDSGGTIQNNLDRIGRIDSVVYPNSEIVSHEYDFASNRTKLVYPDSTYITYEYDELNRLTDIRDQYSSIIAHYDYDDLSQRIGVQYINGTTVSYSYDVTGKLLNLNNQLNSASHTFAYNYDNVGNRISMIVNAAELHSYTYDKIYQLTDAYYPNGYFAIDTTFNYDPAANRQSVINGGTTNYVANNLNQYSSVGGVTYSYDNNGNLTGDGTNSYSYDAENRLITANTPESSIIYDYDPSGRRIAKNVDGEVTKYLYDGDQVICEYNGDDTLLRKFLYGTGIDEPVRMTDVEKLVNISGDEVVDYEDLLVLAENWLNNKYLSEADYDFSGFIDYEDLRLLAEKWLLPCGTDFADFAVLANGWLEAVEVNPDYDESADLNSDDKVDFIDFAILADYWLTDGEHSEDYYYHYDGLGSVVALSDENGDTVETYNYDVYGQVDNISSVGSPYLFTGRRYDSETGLYYYRARYYSPNLGRFLQVDPIGYLGGINLYHYCFNNSINWIDPFGIETYKQARELGGNASLPINKDLSHRFTFTTNPDGSVAHTFSWGNTYRKKHWYDIKKVGQWHMDRPEDIAAAQSGLKDGTAMLVGDDSLDPYVRRAYIDKIINDMQHGWYVTDNCHHETNDLVKRAKDIMKGESAIQIADHTRK